MTSQTICGADRQFYNKRLSTTKRFRLFLCKHTEADIIEAITAKAAWPSPKALAKFCGIDFGRDALARILLNKFMTQVKFLDGRVKMGKPLLRQFPTQQQQQELMAHTESGREQVLNAGSVKKESEGEDGLEHLAAAMGIMMRLEA